MTTLLLLACHPGVLPTERIEPSFIEVELGASATGSSAEAPLPFSIDTVELPVTVRTLDVNGDPTPFDGDLTVKVRPGKIDQDPFVAVTGGEWSGTVKLRAAFGPTRIWFTDEGDKDADSGRAPSFAAGVTDAVHYAKPTIAELQTTDDIETNQLAGEFAMVRVEDRAVVVTARDAAGLWVADTADAPGSGNGLYVYTFSKPDDALAVGAKIVLLTGIDQEYLASTQLSYPTIETDGTTLEVPEAVELTGCEDLEMEGLEASRVRVSGGSISADFVPGSEDYADYETYGQWPLSYGDGCTVYVETGGTAPDFYAPDHAGETLAFVEGFVKQIFDKWVLVVVDAADVGGAQGPSAPPLSASRSTP